MPPTLIITNDFPPRRGGIEGFVADVCRLLDDDVVVLTRSAPGWRDHDRQLDFAVIRHGPQLLPTAAVGRQAIELIRRHAISRVVYGAMAPLSLLAPTLRAAGVRHQLGISHGHESWWASLPGSAQLLRRMADGLDHVSVISDYTRSRIAPALSESARRRLLRLSPPIDLDRFRPAGDLDRSRWSAIGAGPPASGIAAGPRCIAVGRMTRQKGFDTLLRAWGPAVERIVAAGGSAAAAARPELVLAGDGPEARRLHRLAGRLGLGSRTDPGNTGSPGGLGGTGDPGGGVHFTGLLDRDQVARLLQTGTVFALPVRTRLAGLHPEGLGMVFLEAAATGLPVLVGRSGGAPETVREAQTGYVLDPDDERAWTDRLVQLLTDPIQAAALGGAGRELVARRYGDDAARRTLRSALSL